MSPRETERHKEVARTMVDQLNTLAKGYSPFGLGAYVQRGSLRFTGVQNGDTTLTFKVTKPGAGWNVELKYRYGSDVYDLKVVTSRGKVVTDLPEIQVDSMFDAINEATLKEAYRG